MKINLSKDVDPTQAPYLKTFKQFLKSPVAKMLLQASAQAKEPIDMIKSYLCDCHTNIDGHLRDELNQEYVTLSRVQGKVRKPKSKPKSKTT